MKNFTHPNFLLGVFSGIIVIIGVVMLTNGYAFGDYVIGFAAVLGAIHWIWAITDVSRRDDLRPKDRIVWLIATVACPLLGAMLFYSLHRVPNKTVS